MLLGQADYNEKFIAAAKRGDLLAIDIFPKYSHGAS